MNEVRGSRSGSMMRRAAWVLALVSALAALLIGSLSLQQMQQQRRVLEDDRVQGINRSFAHDLESRLAAAAALVQLLSAPDTGPGDQALQQQVLRTDAIRGVFVLPWADPQTRGGPRGALPRFGNTDWLNLSAGLTLLKTVSPEAGRTSIYFIRAVHTNGVRRVAFFDLDPKWLWDDLRNLSPAVSLALVDAAGRRVHVTPALPDSLVDMVRSAPVYDVAPDSALVVRNWQADGQAWRGVVSRLDFGVPRVNSIPWLVFTYAPVEGLLPSVGAMLATLWPAMVVMLLALVVAVLYLGRLWEPVLRTTEAALQRLAAGEFGRVDVRGSADAPRLVADAFNHAATALEQRFTMLRTLGEIEQLLQESDEVEQAFDGVLTRACAVTGCSAAAVVLIDRDADGYGRSFAALGNSAERPVSRINLDAQMLEALRESPLGLTVARCEPERHSFLEPLRGVAQLFWVWPVLVRGRLAAIVTIGFSAQPQLRPELAAYGGEVAARLARALTNNVHGEELYRQAHFDSLTGLPNRLLFRDRLSQEIAATADSAQRGALLYVDLDHFKKVNDSEGHLAGDQLLTIVAQRLRACVKEGDTVARLGGDEFTVILRQVEAPESAQEIAARIIESLQRPVSVAGRDHRVKASIGITLFPDDGNRIEDLMRNADQAMYRAKDGGRSRAVFFDRALASGTAPVAESGLFRALRRREFSLYYQPQYLLRDCSLAGVEALLRWQSPRDGMRYPMEFVPAAEESGLIVDIGAWVLEAACEQMAQWRAQGIAPARLALNVSMQQLRTAQFARQVRQVLENAGLSPDVLELEITESVFAEDEVRTTLRQLAALGVRLSLDDFGTGYSSLNYLRQYPVHSIKIDRSFMQEVPDSIQAATLAETIINMAHALNKTVVAEGVETLEQLDFLRSRGCDLAQGFVLSRPVNVTVLGEMLQSLRDGAAATLSQRVAGSRA